MGLAETPFDRASNMSTRSRTKVKFSFAFSSADNQKPGEMIRQGTSRRSVRSIRSYRSPRARRTGQTLGSPQHQNAQERIKQDIDLTEERKKTVDSIDSIPMQF